MIFKYLLLFLLPTFFFFNFTSLNKNVSFKKNTTYKSTNITVGSCIPTTFIVIYGSHLSYAQRSEIRNYYIEMYEIQVVPTIPDLPTASSYSLENSNTFEIRNSSFIESWYICYNASRPGNGGINREIDEDPDINMGSSFNAM